MEYGCMICDDNFTRHVGWSQDNVNIKRYFSQQTVNLISQKVTQLLQGVNPQNRPIIVPDKTICSVMSDIFNSYRPGTGDIFTRYNIPKSSPTDMIQSMINQVIEIITYDVKVNLGMDECNKKLSIWTTVFGDFNEHGLRRHPPIKLNNRRSTRFQFNMNY